MKKVFALRGPSKTGKTQTNRTFDELLRAKFPGAIVEHEHRSPAELRAVLSIDGVKIGIETTGENIKRINESFDLFVKLGCELIICATRTKGQTVAAVESLPGYEAVWFERRAEADPVARLFSNIAMARQLVDETEKALPVSKPAVLSRAGRWLKEARQRCSPFNMKLPFSARIFPECDTELPHLRYSIGDYR